MGSFATTKATANRRIICIEKHDMVSIEDNNRAMMYIASAIGAYLDDRHAAAQGLLSATSALVWPMVLSMVGSLRQFSPQEEYPWINLNSVATLLGQAG